MPGGKIQLEAYGEQNKTLTLHISGPRRHCTLPPLDTIFGKFNYNRQFRRSRKMQ